MKLGGYRHLSGCASAAPADGGRQAARLRDERRPYCTDQELRAFRHVAFPHAGRERSSDESMPPLIEGDLRLGARVCGEPAWNPDFNTADVLMWLPLGSAASALRAALRPARPAGGGRRAPNGRCRAIRHPHACDPHAGAAKAQARMTPRINGTARVDRTAHHATGAGGTRFRLVRWCGGRRDSNHPPESQSGAGPRSADDR
jgi:hypothetical protein